MVDSQARIIISAVDQTKDALNSVSNNLSGLQSLAGKFGVALSAVGLMEFVRQSIDAADHLNDLSKATDVSVESLAGLRLAAKQSGTDLDEMAKMLSKLSVNMGKNGDKFAEIGVTAKEPIEALKQLSDLFVSIQDPQLRAAVMAEALGKSWQSAAPLLAEGGQKIGEIVDKGARLSGITQDMTEQADALNDKWAELVSTGGLLNRQVAPLLPLLNAFADGLISSQEESQNTTTSFNLLAETIRPLIILAGNFVHTFKTIGNELGGRSAQVASLFGLDDKAFGNIGKVMKKDAEESRAAFDAWEQSILNAGTAAGDAAQQIAYFDETMKKLDAALLNGGIDEEKTQKLRSFVKEQKESASAYDSELKKMHEVEAAARKGIELYGHTASEKMRYDAMVEAQRVVIAGHGSARAVKEAQQFLVAMGGYADTLQAQEELKASQEAGKMHESELKKMHEVEAAARKGIELYGHTASEKMRYDAMVEAQRVVIAGHGSARAVKEAQQFLVAMGGYADTLQAQEELKASQEAGNKILEAERKILEEINQEYQAYVDGMNSATKGIEEDAKRIKDHTFELLHGKVALEDLKAARDLDTVARLKSQLASLDSATQSTAETAAIKAQIKAILNRLSALGDESAAQKAHDLMQKQQEEFIALFNSVESTGKQVFVAVFSQGKNAFEGIGQALKASVIDLLYQMTAKKWIFSMFMDATGASAAQRLAADPTGTYSQANSLYSGASSAYGWATGGSTAAAAGGFTSAQMGGAVMSSSYTAPAIAGGGSGLAAAGWYAAAFVAAAYLLDQMGPTSGPSNMGESSSAFDRYGNATGRNRTFDPNAVYTGGNGMQDTWGQAVFNPATGVMNYSGKGTGGSPASDAGMNALSALYQSTISRLGGTATNGNFGYAVNSAGQTTIHGGAGGTDFLQGGIGNQAELSLATGRVLLTALQGSELPAYLSGYFKTLVPKDMTQAAIDSAMKFADTLKKIDDGFKLSKDPVKFYAEQIGKLDAQLGASVVTTDDFKTAFSAAMEAGTVTPDTLSSWQALGTAVDNSAQASAGAAQAFNALLDSIKTLSDASHTMFADSISTIQLSMLDTRGKYNYYDQQAQMYSDLLKSVIDPNLISQYSSKLNSSIMSGYNLLTPEQQQSSGNRFIEILNQSDNLAQTRYHAAEADAKDKETARNAAIALAITTAVEAAMNKGADAIAVAAGTPSPPVTVNLQVSKAPGLEVNIV